MLGCDISFRKPDPFQLWHAGYRFVLGYGGAGTTDKHLTADDITRYHAASLGIGLLCEGAAGDAFTGYPTGVDHADLMERFMADMNVPYGTRVYFAVDQDTTPRNIDAAVNYFRGLRHVMSLPEVGCYGDLDIIERLMNEGLISGSILTAATDWSHGMSVPYYVTMIQHNNGTLVAGGEVDQDDHRFWPDGIWLPNHYIIGGEQTPMRYLFMPSVGGDGKHVYVTDGLRYRIQPLSFQVDGWAAQAGAGPIVAIDKFPADTWDLNHLIESLCGKVDPGEYIGPDLAHLDVTGTFTATAAPPAG